MEKIFSESIVLKNIDDNIKLSDIQDIIQHIELWQIIYENKQITNNELIIAIKILHKYNVEKFYLKCIKILLNRLLELKIDNNLDLNDDIINDIINLEPDKNDITCYLLGGSCVLTINDFVFTEELLDYGIKNGYLNMNCPYDVKKIAKYCTLKMFNKIIADGISNPILRNICRYAARYGNLDIIKWIYQCAPEYFYDNHVSPYAAMGGHLNVLHWAYDKLLYRDSWTCVYAAKYGHFETLKWLRETECPWNYLTTSNAAKGGHFEILKWAVMNGCPIGNHTCSRAAKGGHLEILKWLREIGCSWDIQTCYNAAKMGNISILKWAIENGCNYTDQYLEMIT